MMKFVRLKDSDPLGMRMAAGAVVLMGDGWRGRVESDDGEYIVFIRDGEKCNDVFRGYRGITRRQMALDGAKAMYRSLVVDCEARKLKRCSLIIVDRARLESEWSSAPGYN
jgi:hypothetical protein